MTLPTLKPQTSEELADVIRDSAANGGALEIHGNASKRGIGHRVDAQPLSVAGLSGITVYDPEEMVISVKAGTPLKDVIQVLNERAQVLGFEPSALKGMWSDMGDATIGGTAAAAISGPRRFALGAARDHLLGFAAVNGRGELFKAGGSVVKNVTGYDLPKLAAGSFGTLFVMTDLTFRVYPKAIETRALCVEGLSLSEGLTCLGSMSRSPLEPSGLTYLPATADQPSQTLCRFEGEPEGVRERIQFALKILGHAARDLDSEKCTSVFEMVANVAPFFDEGAALWRVSVPQTAAHALIEGTNPEKFTVDGAGGTVWLQSATAGVHAQAAACGGHALLLRQQAGAPEPQEIFQPMEEVMTALVTRLKDAFDPHRVLNPGRMYRSL